MDPLFPYIFVLCIERLSHRINQAVHDKKWNPIHLSQKGIPISHLFFVDDLLLFAETSIDLAMGINKVLSSFYFCSSE